MRLSSIDSVTWCEISDGSPLRIEQRTNSSSAVLFLMVLLPALVAVVLPVVALGVALVSEGPIQADLSNKVGSLLLVALGFGVLATLFGFPAWRYLGQLGARRTVEIADGHVQVFDKSVFGRRCWSCSLMEFDGVVHRIRSTLSGVRHELVLTHAQSSKSVLLRVAGHISDRDAEHVGHVLGHGVRKCSEVLENAAAHGLDVGHAQDDTRLAA